MSGFSPGLKLPARTVTLTRADLAAYAAASGDSNPIHVDDAAARAVGLPGVVAHGMLTLGRAMTVVAEFAGGPDRLVEFGARFIKPVPVPAQGGVDLIIEGTVTTVDEEGTADIDLTVTASGTKVLGMAKARVRPS
jgi:acyl dehydratase